MTTHRFTTTIFSIFFLSGPVLSSPTADSLSFQTTHYNTLDCCDTSIYTCSEQMPLFQNDGEPYQKFRQWIGHHLRYPLTAMQEGIQGRVLVEFVVEKDSSLSYIKILQSPHPLLSNETLRLLKSSPKWTPANNQGKVIRLKLVMPIRFMLQ